MKQQLTESQRDTVKQFEQLADAGLVRIKADEEQENYFDVYGEPEGYENQAGEQITPEQERKEIEEQIERDGCWRVVSEYWDGHKWKHADSVGMCAGYRNVLDPAENCYVTDLMQSAIGQVPQCGEH